MAERRAACRYALFLAMFWLHSRMGQRQNSKRRAFLETLILVAVGSEGMYVRVIGIVRSFQDSLHIVPHDTRPVERQNSVRSRLRLQKVCHRRTTEPSLT